MSIPEYQSGQYYVWDTEAAAQAALDFINNCGVFPMADGITTCWASGVQERLDGKWVFPRVPPARLIAAGVSVETATQFYTDHTPAVEVYDSDWFTEEEL